MISRGIRILAQPLIKRNNVVKMLQSVRKSHGDQPTLFNYRTEPPKSPRWTWIAGDALNAFMWWWIFVHCYYQWGHVVGEYDYPDYNKWTDAQLGVVEELD